MILTASSALSNNPDEMRRDRPGADGKLARTGVTPTFCLTGDDEALGQGRSTWAIVLAHKMAFKCKFPLGPKGELASALALLISNRHAIRPHLHNGQNGNEAPALSGQDKKKKEIKKEGD